jgi:hypothetical protein
MEIEELFGLPAHPLIVHAALALVPTAAVLTVVGALWPAAQRRIGWLAVVLAAIAVVTVWLAQGSGEELEHQVDETNLVEEHAELGDQMLIPSIAMLVGAVLVTAAGRRGDGGSRWDDGAGAASYSTRGASAVSAVVAVVALAASGFAVIQMARVGHSGAKAVWDDTGTEGQDRPEGGEESDEGLGLGEAVLAALAVSAARRRLVGLTDAGAAAEPEGSPQ